MQNVSQEYRDIVAGNHWFENRLCIGDTGKLIDKSGSAITFGGVRILVDSGGAETGYGEELLISMEQKQPLLSDSPDVGKTCAGEINVEMIHPYGDIPKRALLRPYIRAANENAASEWLPQGKYYIDKRSEGEIGDRTKLTLHGYDGMLLLEVDYPAESSLNWPASDIEVLKEISDAVGISLDSRVYQIVTSSYEIPYPAGYSCREVIGYIGAMYTGSWAMTATGELMLVTLTGLPKETNYLIVGGSDNRAITFGGVRILV